MGIISKSLGSPLVALGDACAAIRNTPNAAEIGLVPSLAENQLFQNFK